ncbi:MAG: chemotaxis protein CheC [Candidatus Palauibacterales bacterium]|nr:chemotaxis protein CheC [Candidatus Palauibacterales bacterium]
MNTPALSALEVDALRELANVGSGHAATALAQLTGVGITIDIPRVSVAPLGHVIRGFAPNGERLVSLAMRMLGNVTGQTLFVMREENADLLCRLILRERYSGSMDGVLERSSLQETGNIMAGSFLNALAAWLSTWLLPSVPTILVGSAEAVTPASAGEDEEPVLVVETSFLFDDPRYADHRLTGVLLFEIDRSALAALLKSLGAA